MPHTAMATADDMQQVVESDTHPHFFWEDVTTHGHDRNKTFTSGVHTINDDEP